MQRKCEFGKCGSLSLRSRKAGSRTVCACVVLLLLHGQGFLLRFGQYTVTLILGLRRDVDVICGLLCNCRASCGNYLPHDAV
jgi:hypothetical protein